ncbi:unnamed protein product [Jaminaea pallidilutea]
MSEATYPLTPWLWPEEGVLEVFDAAENRIVLLALRFLRLGDVLDWNYILFACKAVVNESDGVLYHDRREDTPLQTVDLTSTPEAGKYLYLRPRDRHDQHHDHHDQSSCTWATGPRFKYARRGPDITDTASDTMSHSSRSTIHQNTFRDELRARDGFCLVTGHRDAVAAHILPQSRPEYYREILGYDPGYYFYVSFGLFLDPKHHRAFDRGSLALYPCSEERGQFIVHVFDFVDGIAGHGKRITPSTFRVAHPAELPDRRLLIFHYRQCLIKHARGFASFPGLDQLADGAQLA